MAWFLSDVQQGRDPSIQGGVTDPFGCAYVGSDDELQELEVLLSSHHASVRQPTDGEIDKVVPVARYT